MIIALSESITNFVCGHGHGHKSMPTPTKVALALVVLSGCAIIVGAVGGAVGFWALPAALILAVPGGVLCLGCILFIFSRRTGELSPKGAAVSGNSAGSPPQKSDANPSEQESPDLSDTGVDGGVGAAAGGAGEKPVTLPAVETPSASPEADIQSPPPGPIISPATPIPPILPDPHTADLPPQKWEITLCGGRIDVAAFNAEGNMV
jgi:hypothetical protein